mmetsp:Transcript_99588/g.155660  ORF Transcript_99588/g.155660 Transcript_99588/m.155660 type:complete len:789 (+) Transcript_99588:45-2411(+)
MSSLTSAAKSLGENAEFLYKSIFKAQPNAESARRYYAVLRQWAGSGKAYRGRTFTRAEVEEAILAFERDAGSAPEPAPKLESDAKRPMTETPESAKRPKTMNHFWPRWVLDSKSVEVLVPAQGGKPAAWTTATPVGIGYRGQKKHFLFVRSVTFEMDCRRQEVRKLGGRQTVQELLDDMHGNGIDVTSHPEWTDGSDSGSSSRKVVDFVAPGVQPEGMPKEDSFPVPEKPSLVKQASTEMFDELEGDFERMALLQRSRLVKIKTSDHPDPLTEPRATASIKLPQLTENDVLMMTPAQAEKNLSSLQLETCTLAARRFRQTLVDGRASGYVIGDGTGCGKGRCIAALMVHLWNSGCRRNIWVSATNDLYYDAVRDLKDLGADIPCISLRRLPPSAPLDKWGTETNKELFKHFGAEGDGIIFVTYSLLVQTGTRRQLYACPIKTEETRTALLGSDLLDERLRVTRDVSSFSEISDVPLDLHKGDRIVNIKALKHVTRLARQSKSISLANLASNMSSVVVLDYESGGDPFNKLKTLLSDYLTALEAKEAEEASQQVACEKSISEAAAKTASIRLAHINDNGLIEKFLLSSVSAAKHNSTLASIDQSIRIGDQLRSDEREAFEKNRETLESGLDGVMKAQNLLRDLHSEDRHGDVAIRIWENLIRSQADFTKELSKVKADEADAAAKHEAYLKQAEIDTASTASDARTTSEEVATLRRKIVDDAPEVAGDLDSMAAYDKLKADCESRVDVHDQQARRRLEIESLRTAFQLLHEDEGLVHTVAKRRSRGFLQK